MYQNLNDHLHNYHIRLVQLILVQVLVKLIYKLEYIEKVVIACKMTEEEKVQKIIAFVKLKDNILKKTLEIRSDLSKILPSYMCPIIKIVNEFPLNRNGKCDKKKLMEEYCYMEEKVIVIIERVTDFKELSNNLEIDLIENEILDSLAFIELMTELEEEFDIEIQPTQVSPDTWRSVKTIIELVKKMM